ncbi:hypothetical protein PRIPAC_77222 [Pristionchus pacificus]|uniref:Uncharacterized protein n=1 Tax=Pristionchus pacificus TaxID=54126 RepID=A0A2A6CJL0_PRIPA|nr:hypothetical protein PRIPAC_77222 [Pristionchus pacificus]|eukprot:PDM78268.1 hypothetical protein PRIPAC_30847 [Pristionchus pacificus]
MVAHHFAAADIDICFPPIAQSPVELIKGNEGWNQLATDFINGVTSGLSNDLITEIGNLIFGKGGKEGKDVAEDLFNSQVKSPCMNITGIILAFIAFGFVVSGITLYCLSIDSFVNGVLKAPNQLTTIFSNVNNFTTGAASQISCSVTNGFGQITTEVEKLPDEPDYTALGKTFTDNKKAVDDIVAGLTTALNNAAVAGNAAAQTAVQNALTSYSTFDELLKPTTANNIPQTLNTLGGQITGFQTNVDKLIKDNAAPIAATATTAINSMIDTVNSVVDGINQAIDGVVNLVNNVLDFFNQIEKNLNDHDEVTGWITAGFKSIVTAPSVVALLGAFVAFVAGSFLACKKKSLPSKGCCSASCTLIVLSILTLAVAFIVMLTASFVMTLGYGTQLVCQPFFYDDKLQALTAIDDIFGTVQIPSMTPNKKVTLKFSEVMISCKDTKTFMEAVKGDDIIDITVITSAIDVTGLTTQLDNAIDGAAIPALNVDFTGITAALSLNLVPDLSAAKDLDPPDVNAVTAQMQALKVILQPAIDTLNTASTSAADLTDPVNIKKVLKSTSNDFIKALSTELTNVANQFKTDLITKSAPCTPVYQSYEDVGHLGCEQMGGGVQGMWAGAGLAALFFIPAIIATFFVASALRGGKAAKVNIPDDEDPYKISAFNSGPMVSPYIDQPNYTSPWESEVAKPVPAAAAYYNATMEASAPPDEDSESECSMRL